MSSTTTTQCDAMTMTNESGLRRRVLFALLGLWVTFGISVLVQIILAGPIWAAEPIEVVGIDLQNVGQGDSMVRLVVKTSTGEALGADQIQYKVKNRVVRITFLGAPLSADLGQEVPFAVDEILRVDKGYALPDGATQSFVRLRFDAPASLAIEGRAVEAAPGGFAITLPFGQALGAGAGEDKAPDEEAKAPVLEKDPEDAEKGGDLGALLAAVPAKKKKTTAIDKKPEAAGTPLVLPEAPVQGRTPIQLADSSRGPNMGNVALSLALVIFLILAFGVGYKKLQQIKLNGGWAVPSNAVKVLSTHRIARGVQIIIVEVLGEVVVLGQSQTGLRLLYKMPEHKSAQLRHTQEMTPVERPQPQINAQEALAGLLGRLRGGDMNILATGDPSLTGEQVDEQLHETLEDLAASLDAQTPEHPEPLMKLIKTQARDAAASSDIDSVSFDSFLERRLGKDQWRTADSTDGAPTAKAASKLARAAEAASQETHPARKAPTRRAPLGPVTRPTRLQADDDELDDVTRSIRNRARAMGRL